MTPEQRTAYAYYQATMRRMAARYNPLDCFDRPSLKRPAYVAADQACQAAWQVQDYLALRQALATWEQTIIGTGSK